MALISLVVPTSPNRAAARWWHDEIRPAKSSNMNLPNYFIADLPPEATLGPGMITEACQTLKRNREHYLAHRTTHACVTVLSRLAGHWQRAEYPFRRLALEQGPAATGFSRATLARGLDDFFRELTAENFQSLLEQDLGQVQRLDGIFASEPEHRSNRSSIATAPQMLVHIAAGNLPPPTLMGLVLGVLARSAQFVKCASGASLLPRLFAHSLYEEDAKLGACLEIAEWRGGNAGLERALFEEADCVTVTGSDETLNDVRQHLPPGVRLLAYGHRVSFGYIESELMGGVSLRKVLDRATDDITAWNQLGCLSPHVLYIQDGGLISPEKFPELLSERLAERESLEPRGELPPEAAAAIATRRSIYQVRAAHSPETRYWCSPGSTAWTVVYETDPRFQLSCLNRFIYVKSVKDLKELLQSVDPMRGKVSTVGLAASPQKAPELALELARWGVTRVCPLGQMQRPPLGWRHDGRPALGDLVTWTDLETGP
jgi:hypothetical protein